MSTLQSDPWAGQRPFPIGYPPQAIPFQAPARAKPQADKTLHITATHESGHAVAFSACGVPIEYVEVSRRGGEVLGTRWPSDPLQHYAILRAALYAEVICGPIAATDHDRSDDDSDMARIVERQPDPVAFRRRGDALAARIVRENRAPIVLLASALSTYGRIDGDHPALKNVRPVMRVAALRAIGLRAGPVSHSNGVQVDPVAGVIRNVAVMTIGPALGHGFEIDSTSIDQLIALAAAAGVDGVKSRFKHPAIEDKKDAQGNVMQSVADDSGTMVGRIKNIRRVGNQARGDVYLGSYASMLPALGDVRSYLVAQAEEDPAGIGLSAMFAFEPLPITDRYGEVEKIVARLTELYAIDFVGKSAANPNGLLSAKVVPGPSSSGWQDPAPADPASAPIPVVTPDEIENTAADLRRMIASQGPLSLGGFAARCKASLEAIRAGINRLVNSGHAIHVAGFTAPTPRGITAACMNWN